MLFLFFWSLLLIPIAAQAQEFVPLSGLPALQESNDPDLPDILNTIYVVAVAVGAIVAVIKIAIAGTKYVLSEIVTDKSDAKKDINSALLGLIIILATYVVLHTIYPGIVDFNILQNAGGLSTSDHMNTAAAISGIETNTNTPGTPSCRTC